MTDFSGREIAVGDRIVGIDMRGQASYLQFYTVTKITDTQITCVTDGYYKAKEEYQKRWCTHRFIRGYKVYVISPKDSVCI